MGWVLINFMLLKEGFIGGGGLIGFTVGEEAPLSIYKL